MADIDGYSKENQENEERINVLLTRYVYGLGDEGRADLHGPLLK